MDTNTREKNAKNTTARLTALAEMLPGADVIADIGSDHGLLCAHLLQNGICKKAIAVDVSPSAAEKAARLAQSLGLAGRLIPRQGDGLTALLPGEAGAAVIAGMGGRLIASILRAAPRIVASIPLALQPMQQIGDLRKFLRENGFRVLEERMVKENGRIFEMMTVAKGQYEQAEDIPEELADEIGPLLWQRGDPLLCESLRRSARGLERLAAETQAPPEVILGLKARAEAYAKAADKAETKRRQHVFDERTVP